MTFKHTDETDARIRRGYEAGERVRDIADDLGVTKNTVIGRARDLNLCRSDRPTSPFTGWLGQDPETQARVLDAMNAGRDLYNANREPNHSANLASERAE